MKPVPKSENAFALEKRSVLIVVQNEDFSFRPKSSSLAKIIFSNLSAEATKKEDPNEIDILGNDPGWYTNYE
jgi:hypothetical protein